MTPLRPAVARRLESTGAAIPFHPPGPAPGGSGPDTLRLAWLMLWLALLAVLSPPAQAGPGFLDPEQAFQVHMRSLEAQRLELHFEVATGYHLYRERIGVSTDPPGALRAGEPRLPPGEKVFDNGFQKEVEIFRRPITLPLALASVPGRPMQVAVSYQGCADDGLCYPPTEQRFEVSAGARGLVVKALAEAGAGGNAGTGTAGAQASATTVASSPQAGSPGDEVSRFAGVLQSRNLLVVAGVFALAGLLLAFTPCVLPMLPILSSIIVGQHGPGSRSRSFGLSVSYSLGMALVYTAMGMAAGLMGEGLAAALQNAWVLGAFALLLVALSLSMFGLYELQLPVAWQSGLSQVSGRFQGGRHAGVFAMGGLSALIVGPCIAAPLAGALVYISQSRDVVLGGVALFSMAAGMSVPLLLMGLSARSLLPRAGHWMERVKHFFGALLLAVALWMVSPVLPPWALMLGMALLLLGCAVYLGAFERLDHHTPRHVATKGLGIALGVLGLLQVVGVAAGGRDPLQPLRPFAVEAGGLRASAGTLAGPAAGPTDTGSADAQAATMPGAPTDGMSFEPVASLVALDQRVQASRRPVMLDLYADWCVSCKEFEALTLSDTGVRQRLRDFTLLRVDVTANSAEHKALMKRYGLFGPPALLFFPPAGGELAQARVIGFVGADAFRDHLDKVRAQGAAPDRGASRGASRGTSRGA